MSSTEPSRLSHARHNLDACELLRRQDGHSDWVVTTAFYAANHYVRSKIFPVTEHWIDADVTDDTFGGYCTRRGQKSDHGQLKKLVRRHLKPVYGRYTRLLEASWASRYNDYRIASTVERAALEDLRAIITACDPAGPSVTGL